MGHLKIGLAVILFLFINVACYSYLSVRGFPAVSYGDPGLMLMAFGQVADYPTTNYNSDPNWSVPMIALWSTGGMIVGSFNLDIRRITIYEKPFRVNPYFSYTVLLFQPFYGFANGYQDPIKISNNYYLYELHELKIGTTFTYFILTNDSIKVGILAGQHYQFDELVHTSKKQPDGNIIDSEKPFGYRGGSILSSETGFSVDTRDDEGRPTKGYFQVFDYRINYFDYYYHTISETFSFFYKFFQVGNFYLVTANRLEIDFQIGSPPFYSMNSLGGRKVNRGIPSGLFVNPNRYIFTPEIRANVFDFGDFHYELVGSLEMGETFKNLDTFGKDFQIAENIGMNFCWGNDFIIAFDFGFWKGGLQQIYMDFGHVF